ncbi:vegetative cell wall protein gp1-like [Miscanthus floridulus]|uniref:vegetative cell wall protein gp1-like n=1 Tax=Miscanthus floridulus TaxID=154761 RepID=UPI003459EC2D
MLHAIPRCAFAMAQPNSRAWPASALAHSPGLPQRYAASFPRAAPDHVRARSPVGRHAPATHAARQPWPTSPSTRSPSSAAPAALPTPHSHSVRSHDSSSSRPLSPPNAAAAPPATYPPSTPSSFDS